MKKSSQYAKNGALILGIGSGFWNIITQLDAMHKDPNVNFDWVSFFKALGKGALVGGVTGYAIGWIIDYNNNLQEPIDLNTHLSLLAGTLILNKFDPEFEKLRKSVEYLTVKFKDHFNEEIHKDVIMHGSTEKGTALNYDFDIDIAIPFKPGSFPNNGTMYNEVFSFFKDRVGQWKIKRVRKQKRSIGVTLNIDGREYRIDFAPYKLSSSNNTSGYLYVNKRNFIIDNSTIQKTDINKLKKQRLTKVRKQIVVILKDWKSRNNLPLSSHLLEYLILDTYKYNIGRLPKNIEGKVVLVLDHIADNLQCTYIRGIENTNNIITNSIGEEDKDLIVDVCRNAIENYNYQPNSLARELS